MDNSWLRCTVLSFNSSLRDISMRMKPILFLFMVIFWVPSWCQAGEAIKDRSCVAIMESGMEFNPNWGKYPALRHLCNLVFDLYGEKKDEERVLLERYKEIYEKHSALIDPKTDEEGKDSPQAYEVIKLEETENGLDLAKTHILLRHYEALFSLLEKFAWQEDFDEKAFWKAWGEESDRIRNTLHAIHLTRINLFSYLMKKYESLNNAIERDRLQQKLDRLQKIMGPPAL